MSDARAPGPEAGAARAEPAGAALSVDVAGLLAQLARSFALLLPVYALGYLGLSFSWVLLALALLVWCRRSRGLKATRLCRALALLEDEERAVRLGVRACDLPAWVSARRGARRHHTPRPCRVGRAHRAASRPTPGPAPLPLPPATGPRDPSRASGPGRCQRAPTCRVGVLASSRARPSGACRPAVPVRAGFPQTPVQKAPSLASPPVPGRPAR